MTYKEICGEMAAAGWGNHFVLCAKQIGDPFFNRRGAGFCTVGNIKQLDTFTLYEQVGPAPDMSNQAGERVRLRFYSPCSGGGTNSFDFPAWIYRDQGLVEFVNNHGKHLLCALSDVEHKL